MLMVTVAPPAGDGLVGVVGLSLPPPPHAAEAIARTAHPNTVSLDMRSSFPAHSKLGKKRTSGREVSSREFNGDFSDWPVVPLTVAVSAFEVASSSPQVCVRDTSRRSTAETLLTPRVAASGDDPGLRETALETASESARIAD
jgi:hypothetical protein